MTRGRPALDSLPRPPRVAAATLLLVGLGAAWGPARRATRIDPLEAIRAE